MAEGGYCVECLPHSPLKASCGHCCRHWNNRFVCGVCEGRHPIIVQVLQVAGNLLGSAFVAVRNNRVSFVTVAKQADSLMVGPLQSSLPLVCCSCAQNCCFGPQMFSSILALGLLRVACSTRADKQDCRLAHEPPLNPPHVRGRQVSQTRTLLQ